MASYLCRAAGAPLPVTLSRVSPDLNTERTLQCTGHWTHQRDTGETHRVIRQISNEEIVNLICLNSDLCPFICNLYFVKQ